MLYARCASQFVGMIFQTRSTLAIENILLLFTQPLSREVFWHEYAKIPRHTSQNSIAVGNLE